MVMIQSVSEYVFLARRRSTPAGVASSSRLSTQGSQIGGSAERSFSALKRLKTWLRTRMSDDRLRSLALMSFEKELTADLEANVEDLVLQFADITDQRMPLV